MSLLAKHRFTVADYYRMGEAGVIPPEARLKLLEGEVIDAIPPSPFHASVLARLNRLFVESAKGRWLVHPQNPLRLDGFSEPLPELTLLRCTPAEYTDRHPEPADVFWLIEIAESSLLGDRKKKLPLYGRAGIGEVWIVNLDDRKVEVYREPNFSGYGSHLESAEGTLSPLAFPDVTLSVAGILRRSPNTDY